MIGQRLGHPEIVDYIFKRDSFIISLNYLLAKASHISTQPAVAAVVAWRPVVFNVIETTDMRSRRRHRVCLSHRQKSKPHILKLKMLLLGQ